MSKSETNLIGFENIKLDPNGQMCFFEIFFFKAKYWITSQMGKGQILEWRDVIGNLRRDDWVDDKTWGRWKNVVDWNIEIQLE